MGTCIGESYVNKTKFSIAKIPENHVYYLKKTMIFIMDSILLRCISTKTNNGIIVYSFVCVLLRIEKGPVRTFDNTKVLSIYVY